MKEYTNQSKKEETDSITDLIRLPSINLEKRVKLFESEIQSRKRMSDSILSTLETKKARIQDQINGLQYSGTIGDSFIVKRDFQKQVNNFEIDIVNELTGRFRDVFMIKEKLQEAKEELEVERQKMQLLV